MSKTEELKAAIAAKGLRYVGTRGSTGAPICLVGEAPGEDEDQQGQPFVGASGRELDRMLAEAGLHTNECWWTNPYKTRPPNNKIDRLAELGIPKQLFIDQFYEELNAYKPTFIIPLGATPLGILCPFTISKRTGNAEISKWRGSILRCDTLPWEHYVVSSFHPAFIFRAWEERQTAVLCLAKVAEEYAYWKQHSCLQSLPNPSLITDPGADTVIDFLRSLLSTPTIPVGMDIENIGIYKGKFKVKQRNRIPYVVGLGNKVDEAMSIDLAGYERNKTIQIWLLLNEVLQKCTTVTQNGYTHDFPWMQYLGFSPNLANNHDTLVRHHVLWPELSHKLDFLTFQYTRYVYYKDEGVNWSVKERQKMKRYNCKDIVTMLEVYYGQEKEFECRQNLH
jgi:uracil-DNA glycosylase family 4